MTTDRRGFLRLAGLGAVAAAAACTSGGPTAQPGAPIVPSTAPTSTVPTPPPTTAPPTSTVPPPPDWAALRGRLAGSLVLPGDADYDAARTPFAVNASGRRPLAVARCASASDVQACVEVARTSRIPVAARSGGHSYAGYSTPDGGLVIDVSALNGVRIEGSTAVVGAGTRLIDVYTALAARGRAIPAGSCPTVGIAGLTLGGGQGVLTRAHGLTCDRLRAADVVLADSTAEPADDDLLWALRGGGGGNCGVVTAFTFETVAAAEVTIFSRRYGPGSVPDVLGAWQSVMASAPRELWSNCVVSAGAAPTCRVTGCFVGPRSGLQAAIAGLPRGEGFAETRGHLDAMLHFAGCSTPAACGRYRPQQFVASSRVLAAATDRTADVAALVRGRSRLDLLFDSLGGAVADVAPDATAFPHRGALATVQVYAAGSDPAPVAEVQAGLADIAGPGAYVNYIDPGQQDWRQAYHGANLPRLLRTAARYDPDAVFAFPQELAGA